MVALNTGRETAKHVPDELDECFAMADGLKPTPEWEAYEAGIASIGG